MEAGPSVRNFSESEIDCNALSYVSMTSTTVVFVPDLKLIKVSVALTPVSVSGPMKIHLDIAMFHPGWSEI